MYILQKNMICLYIKYIILHKLYEYENGHIDIFNIYCMCVYLCIHNTYTQKTYTMQTIFFILDAINHD